MQQCTFLVILSLLVVAAGQKGLAGADPKAEEELNSDEECSAEHGVAASSSCAMSALQLRARKMQEKEQVQQSTAELTAKPVPLHGMLPSRAGGSGLLEGFTGARRHCSASEFNLSGGVHLGFLQPKNLHLFDHCNNVYFKFVRCLRGQSSNNSSATCQNTVGLWTGRSHGDRESWFQWKGMINNRLTTMVAGTAGFRSAVDCGGPYAYFQIIGVRPSFQGPDATFGLAVIFNGADNRKTIIDATWDNFNNVHAFPSIFNAGLEDQLQLRKVFGSGWAEHWRSLLLSLNQDCGLLSKVCPCPNGAAWCTDLPCRAKAASHQVLRSGINRYDPAAVYAQQPFFRLSAAEVREMVGIPTNVTLDKAEYDPCALGGVSFFWDLRGRQAVLHALQREATSVAALAAEADKSANIASSEGCRHATFLYRLWGAIVAGMGPLYSGLAEPCEQSRTTGHAEPIGPTKCSWTYDSAGHRGVVESWAPQGRLHEDYGAAVLTWPDGLGLREDCEQVLGGDPRCNTIM